MVVKGAPNRIPTGTQFLYLLLQQMHRSLHSVFFLIICMPPSLEQGTKYVRLPSGFTFPESSNYLSNPDEGSNKGRNAPPVPQAPPRAQMVESGPPPGPDEGGSEYVFSPPPVGGGGVTPATPQPPSAPPQTSNKESGISQFKQMMMKKIEEMQNKELEGEGTKTKGGGAIHTASSAKDRDRVINNIHAQGGHVDEQQKSKNLGHVLSSLGGGQFYQSIFGGRNGFSPLSFFLNQGGRGGGPGNFFVPVPIVVPPPPPPPPGPKCYTNPSGFLCCNVTLEKTIEKSFEAVKEEGISLCNAQKMASAVQEAAQKKFGTSFETVVAHKDFVAKVNFAGDLNCKIEVDGKYILAYATPMKESEVNIIDANSFFSGDAEELFDGNGTEAGKPTYIVYGPI